MRLLVVGGSDAGISAALRARELDPTVEVTSTDRPHWQLDFPGDDLEAMRAFCTEVGHRVQALVADLHPPSR